MAFAFILLVFSIIPSVVLSVDNPTITFNIMEELPNGYPFGSIANKSREFLTTNETDLRYNFLGTSTSQTMFSIHDRSGDIFTSVVIDRESVCQYNFDCQFEFDVNVLSSDNSFLLIVTVVVIIEDKNDNSPLFQKNTETIPISEGSSIGDVFDIEPAVDRDYSENNSIQSYQLILENGDEDMFSLSWKKNIDMTFDVKLMLEKKLDRESKDMYSLKVVAMDGGNPAKSGSVVIIIRVNDTNDNAPEFSKDIYNVTVEETISPFMTILPLTAEDKDIGENAKISYRISEHQKDRDILDTIFFVGEQSGEVKVKTELSSYAGQSFEFIVVAADNGPKSLSSQARVIIHVEDSGNNPPIVTVTTLPNGNILFINVTENAVLKTFVAHVNVEDPDQGNNGNVTCDVSNKHFAVEGVGSKGYIVIVNSSLDREVKNIHNITVICKDHGSPVLSGSASFLVRVTDKNDNKPTFDKPVYTAKLNENNEGNERITQVSATDDDEGNNAVFHYAPHPDINGRFIIDPNTGVITVNTILDREAAPVIEFRVLAVDNGSPKLTGTATISLTVEDRNDQRPTFTKSVNAFFIKENQPTGTDITILTAEDEDIGLNAEFDFEIAPEYINEVPFILFADGLLKANKQLDREERSRYDFVAIVTDHGENPLSSSAHFTIFVEDVNDNPPIVTFPKPSNNSVTRLYPDIEDDFVAMIEAYDLDEGQNRDLQYSIQSGNDLDIFNIDPDTGYLYFDEKVDIGADKTVTLDISVKDKGEQPLQTVKQLFVELKYTNATFIGSREEDNSKYIIISVVVVIVTLVISGVIIGAILFMRTLDKRRKQMKEPEHLPSALDSDFGFPPIQQNHTILTVDTLSSRSDHSNEGQEVKKKEVSFILDTSNSLEYHQKQSVPSLTSAQPDNRPVSKVNPQSYSHKPGKSPGGLDTTDLQNEANVQLHSMKMQQMILQNRARQWVHSQHQFGTLPHDDHHSEGSSETIGSDSGRGYSEEDDMFSTPSGDDPKLFEVSSPGSQHSRVSRQPDMYTEIQRSSSCVKKPYTYKPNVAQRDFKKPSQHINIRNLNTNIGAEPCDVLTDNYSDLGRNRVSWGSSAMYGHLQPLDYTGDSALHSFFDKTPMAYIRDDEDSYSTTTSGSYTIHSEEIL